MADSEHRSPLTLEDLLRLKRAERPSPEFWSRFESELRQKQLAALLERRPWWQSMLHLLSQRRAFIPLGASAVLAVTLALVSVNNAPQHVPGHQPLNSDRIAPPIIPAQAAIAGASAQDRPDAKATPATATGVALDESASPVAEAPLSEHLPENAAELTPWTAPSAVQSRSVLLFANDNVQLDRSEHGLSRSLSGDPLQAGPGRKLYSGGAGAELASVASLVSKRTRLLAQFGDRQFAPDPQAPASIRERLARRLADNGASLSDHYARVGFRGDQVSLRF